MLITLRRNSLHMLLAVYVLLPTTLWIALVAWFAGQGLTDDLERSLQEDVELVGRAIRAPIARAMESDDVHEVTRTLLSTLDIGRVYGLLVYDRDGRLMTTAGDVDNTRVAQDLDTEVGNEGRFGAYERLGGQRVYSYFLPLYDSGNRPVGLLQITRRRREMDHSLWVRRLKALGVTVAGAIGLAGLALWGHNRALSRHLTRLGEDMAQVQSGQRDHRARTDGPLEIARLAGALNAMLDSMARAESELTLQRNRETALRARLAQSEKLAALGQLAAGVAHELGTPLSTIDGHAQRLARALDGSHDQRRSLERIRGEVARTEGIVRQLLEVGRTRGRIREHVTAERPARGAIAAIGDIIDQRRQQVRMHLHGGDATVAVDQGRIEQALINLLDNASQASPAEVCLELSVEVDADVVRYTVRDHGPGVPEEHREQVFEPFFTTKPVGTGTGLGLAVVRSVVVEHDGTIHIDRHEDGGAMFTVILPRGEPA